MEYPQAAWFKFKFFIVSTAVVQHMNPAFALNKSVAIEDGQNTMTPQLNGWYGRNGIFQCIFLTKKFCILIQIIGSIGYQTSDKPFPELMIAQFSDAYTHL